MSERPPSVALGAGIAGGLAAAFADLALAGPTEGENWGRLAAVAVSLLGGAGLLAGAGIRAVAWVLGRNRAAAAVNALAGEPPGALASLALASVLGLGIALGAGVPVAAAAYERGSPGGAALVAALAVALGLGAALRLRRACLRISLPGPLATLLSGTAAAAAALGLLLMEGGPLEAMDGRPFWVALAGAGSALLTAAFLARRQPRRMRKRGLLLRWAGGVALAGGMLFSVVGLGADPELRAAAENAPVSGRLLEGARAALAIDGPPDEILKRVALAAPPAVTPRLAPPLRPAARAAAKKPLHLVLLTIDALRADRVGAYGYRRPLTPALDALAARATLFERAYSQECKTKGSIPSLLTSRWPSDIQWGGERYVPLGDAEVTIAELLLRGGYHTAAFVTHSYFLPSYRLDRGFAHYDTALVSTDPEVAFGRPTSALLADRVLGYLERLPRGRPFFLWAHFFDPHHRYLRHPGFSRFGDRARDRYDGEIAYTDHHVGRVLSALAAHAEADRIAVIVTSDHGEAFGEHGRFFHGQTLYDEEIRVPLLLAVPGAKPRREPTPVGVMDIAPTLLELAGIAPAVQHRGRSLLAAARGEPLDPAPVFAEILPEDRIGARSAVVHRSWKLIYDERRNLLRLFNLREDPLERVNRLRRDPLVASELAGLLFRWRARRVPPGRTPLAVENTVPAGPLHLTR